MDKKDIINTLKLLKEFSKPRNFKQSIDLIVNLKNLNLKKPEDNVDLFVILPHPIDKKLKICAFADQSLKDIAKVFDKVISQDEFPVYKDKKKSKELAKEYDYFIAQANLMGKVATTFGKVLGPKNKMPNPKAGCVFPPTADLNLIKDNLLKTARVKTKNELAVKACIGKEDMKEEDIIENLNSVYNSLIHALPKEIHNIKNVYLKHTMGIPIKIGEKKEEVEKRISEKVLLKKKKEKKFHKEKISKKISKKETVKVEEKKEPSLKKKIEKKENKKTVNVEENKEPPLKKNVYEEKKLEEKK